MGNQTLSLRAAECSHSYAINPTAKGAEGGKESR